MSLLKNRAMILAKQETTYGTDPTPTTSANAIQVYDIELTPEIDSLERRDVGPSLSRLKELGGKQRISCNFVTELKGSGTAGTAPDQGLLFEACGMSAANVAVTSDTYAFQSSSFDGLTLYVYFDGIQHQVHGCAGNFEINLTAGETPKVNWSFSGLWEAPTDVTLPTSQTVDTTVPQVCKNLTLTFGSYAVVADNLTLRSNNTLAERPSLAAATGIAGFQVTDRNPEGSLTPEAILLATKDYWTAFAANTVQALSCTVGGTAGNITTLAAPYCRMRQISYGDRDGILTHEIPFQLSRSGNDDELSIAFT